MLREIVDSTSQCVKIVSRDGIILHINPAGKAMVGIRDATEIQGTSIFDFIAPANVEEWQKNHDRVCGGQKMRWEYEMISQSGRKKPMESHSAPIHLPDGSIAHLSVSNDISDRRKVEHEKERLLEAERNARAEAEKIGRAKDEFLATLSHELRTPLNAILGWANILSRQAQSEEILQGIGVIERNARAQARIIEDLLDMSRIVSGTIRLDVQPVDIAHVLDQAIETVRASADAKQIDLQTIIDRHTGSVTGDPARLQQIFWNLFSNALKFTPKGGWVRATLAQAESHIKITITDNGEGIDGEFLPLIFNRFEQHDSSNTRRYGGLGLGLSITKQLVELHGGSIHATSQGKGMGATFEISLPVMALRREQPKKAKGDSSQTESTWDGVADLSGMDILVVDDEPDAREVLKRLLQSRKATVRTAGSAEEAMELLKQAKPSIIVSDIGMPGENGYSMMRRYRAEESPLGRVPAVALTAYARSEDRVEAIRAGFQIHIPKPVEPAELITIVASLSGRL